MKAIISHRAEGITNQLYAGLASVCSVVVLCILADVHTHPMKMWWGIAVAALTSLIYSRCSFRSLGGALVLFFAVGMSYCGALANIWWFTTAHSATDQMPWLANFDAANDWNLAVGFITGTGDLQSVPRFYGYFMGALMSVLGHSVVVPIMFNVLCYALLLLVMGALGWSLTGSRRYATILMALTGAMSYLTVLSTIIMKDVPLTLCMALVAWQMVRLRHRMKSRFPATPFILLLTAVCAIALLRPNSLLFVVLGCAIMGVSLRPFRISVPIALTALLALTLCIAMHYLPFHYPAVTDQLLVADSSYHQVFSAGSARWDHMVGIYDQLPIWKKILWLPVNVVVQFFIPLPWTCGNYIDFGVTMPYAHFGFAWYFAGAMILYALWNSAGARVSSWMLLAWWGIACTIITAYVSAGHVSRYCIPLLPLLLPAAARAFRYMNGTKSFYIWLGVSTAGIAIALSIAYILFA